MVQDHGRPYLVYVAVVVPDVGNRSGPLEEIRGRVVEQSFLILSGPQGLSSTAKRVLCHLVGAHSGGLPPSREPSLAEPTGD